MSKTRLSTIGKELVFVLIAHSLRFVDIPFLFSDFRTFSLFKPKTITIRLDDKASETIFNPNIPVATNSLLLNSRHLYATDLIESFINNKSFMKSLLLRFFKELNIQQTLFREYACLVLEHVSQKTNFDSEDFSLESVFIGCILVFCLQSFFNLSNELNSEIYSPEHRSQLKYLVSNIFSERKYQDSFFEKISHQECFFSFKKAGQEDIGKFFNFFKRFKNIPGECFLFGIQGPLISNKLLNN